MKTTRMIFRLPENLKVQIEHVAWEMKLPASELLRRIAEDYLQKEEKQEGKKTASVAQQ